MGFILEVSIIDAEVGVEPVDFSSDEFMGNKALGKRKDERPVDEPLDGSWMN
jgi:hypothetical protein